MKLTRRRLGIGLGASAVMAAPAMHVARAWLRDGHGEVPLPAGVVDDASHLESAHVREVVAIEGSTDEAIAAVQRALARTQGPVSIAGARHTMGGHTIAPGGVVLDLAGARSLALDGETLVAGAGACWHHVIELLAPHGRAVEVMQSNADFSIGGSLGANCHGWQPGRGPLVSTVEALTMVLADGSVVRASRSENAALFAHTIGGYGLFGVVVEARLRTTADAMCEAHHTMTSLDALDATLRGGLSADTELAFARLSIVPGDDRFESAWVTAYRRVDGECPALCASDDDDDLTRLVFRGQVGSDFGRRLRWLGERVVGGESGARASRNQLMSEPVHRFANRRRDSTDVLFEGFVPPEAAASYARAIRRIVAAHDVDLLNVTVRHVLADDVTVLRYAAREVLGFVMLITEPRSRAADERLAAASRDMIDAVHDHGGRYYLPYRDHATRDQLHRAYPEAIGFAQTKRRIDPHLRFQNRFWSRYLA